MRNRTLAKLLALGTICFGLFFSTLAQAATLQEIRDRGTLRIAIGDFELEPFYFTQNGERIGYDYDLGNAIAAEVGVKAEFIPLPWEGGVALAWDPGYDWSKFDIAIAAITIKDTRAAHCEFAWYFPTGQMALALKEADYKSVADMKDKKLTFAILGGSVAEDVVKTQLSGDILPFANYEDAIKAVKEKKAVAAVLDGSAALLAAKRDNAFIAFENEPLTNERYGVALPKGSELKAAIAKVVKNIRKDLYAKWFQ